MENGYRDPTADELVQRFRLTSTSSLTSPKPTKPPLTVFKRGSSVIRSVDVQSVAAYSLSRNCVSSLHQNFRSSLIYGKNNVSVTSSDGSDTLKGYLSLHQEHRKAIVLKWMPNQLMDNGSQTSTDTPPVENGDSSRLWRHTIMINMNDIIYIHLHSQGPQQPISLVLVDAEGVQHRPFSFPPGQHCVQFLACLESALSPSSRLDPPLWFEPGKGKALPQVKRKSSFFRRASESSTDENLECHDYVFRIRRIKDESSNSSTPATVPLRNNVLNDFVSQNGFRSHSNSLPNSPACTKKRASSSSVRSRDLKAPALARAKEASLEQHSSIEKESLLDACETVRRQILSRAFYGWLSYCKHMKTVRTHLACTINNVKLEESNFENKIVDREFWQRCRKEKSLDLKKEFWIRTYLNGIQPDIRCKTWPYLLNLVSWKDDIGFFSDKWKESYDRKVEKWKEIEKEVVKRDCEQFENARMRQNSEVDHNENGKWAREKSMSSDVFLEPCQKSKTENIIDEFGTNLHRIEKDVERCDRHTSFFSNKDNLEKLKTVMCTYVWDHLDDGYVQGMCDIAAPLLVIFQNESLTLECFEVLMEKMKVNFPHSQGNAIESNLVNLRTIVQVMDTELYQQFMNDNDYTHLYFAYRWFLLDFKREMKYDDVFKVWEVIWAAEHTVSSHFQLFFALSMLTNYRQILLENNMEFTDVIKFFNEMAEKHDIPALIDSAREKVKFLQDLVSHSTFEAALDQ
ncbi:unnamed protein product [Bursaphelenchus okinawaensis]|uniref:Rab-GAP TBC domain-containing protein n=1 Tax=Bursaphelenchus okinawaensis TaxID=465554 RepID=A0A811KQE8_9BILA|nr:unnamed protein product [Bursaphelenchus okinawaensis]CAG9107950.1 unnamed protein product [Bursaphelenchus okinawaensis]